MIVAVAVGGWVGVLVGTLVKVRVGEGVGVSIDFRSAVESSLLLLQAVIRNSKMSPNPMMATLYTVLDDTKQINFLMQQSCSKYLYNWKINWNG